MLWLYRRKRYKELLLLFICCMMLRYIAVMTNVIIFRCSPQQDALGHIWNTCGYCRHEKGCWSITHATFALLNAAHTNIITVKAIHGFLLIMMLKCGWEMGYFHPILLSFLIQCQEKTVSIIHCCGLCHENEASGYSFPSEESQKTRSRNWILQTLFRTLEGTLLILLWMELEEM